MTTVPRQETLPTSTEIRSDWAVVKVASWLFKQVASPWFSFLLAFVCAIVVLGRIMPTTETSREPDYSRAFGPGYAVLVFLMTGWVARVVCREIRKGGADPR